MRSIFNRDTRSTQTAQLCSLERVCRSKGLRSFYTNEGWLEYVSTSVFHRRGTATDWDKELAAKSGMYVARRCIDYSPDVSHLTLWSVQALHSALQGRRMIALGTTPKRLVGIGEAWRDRWWSIDGRGEYMMRGGEQGLIYRWVLGMRPRRARGWERGGHETGVLKEIGVAGRCFVASYIHGEGSTRETLKTMGVKRSRVGTNGTNG